MASENSKVDEQPVVLKEEATPKVKKTVTKVKSTSVKGGSKKDDETKKVTQSVKKDDEPKKVTQSVKKGGAKKGVAKKEEPKQEAKKVTKKAGSKKVSKKGGAKKKEETPLDAKEETPLETKEEVNTEATTGKKVRYFKVVVDGGVATGRFQGAKPKQAANKALTSIIKAREKAEQSTEGEFKFSIVECTRGSKHKTYRYVGQRQELENPMDVSIGEGSNKKVITYKFNNKVMKDKSEST